MIPKLAMENNWVQSVRCDAIIYGVSYHPYQKEEVIPPKLFHDPCSNIKSKIDQDKCNRQEHTNDSLQLRASALVAFRRNDLPFHLQLLQILTEEVQPLEFYLSDIEVHCSLIASTLKKKLCSIGFK